MLQKVRDFERRYKGGWVAIKSGGWGGGVSLQGTGIILFAQYVMLTKTEQRLPSENLFLFDYESDFFASFGKQISQICFNFIYFGLFYKRALSPNELFLVGKLELTSTYRRNNYDQA